MRQSLSRAFVRTARKSAIAFVSRERIHLIGYVCEIHQRSRSLLTES